MLNKNAYYGLNQIEKETEFLNIFNNHWAALKANHRIQAEINLEHQIGVLLTSLSKIPIMPMANIPGHLYDIPWDDLRADLAIAADVFSARTGWDKFACLISILTAVAMASCGSYTVMVKQDWLEPLNIYTLNIAPSGANKSAAIKIIRQPFDLFVNEQRETYDQSAEFRHSVVKEQTKAIKKMSEAGIDRAIKDKIKADEAHDYNSLIQLVEEQMKMADKTLAQVEATKPGSRPNLFLSDCSSKGLQAGLSAHDECLAICEPEGDLLLKAATDSRFDISLLLKGFGREEHTYIKSGKEIRLHRPTINIINSIQPDLAAKFYQPNTSAGRGLNARFLPVFVQHQPPKTNDEDHSKYDLKISQILSDCYSRIANQKERILKIDNGALKSIESFQEETEALIRNGLEHAPAFLHKLRGTAGRLAGALHLWSKPRCADEALISSETMSMAIEMARALISHADYAYHPLCLAAFNDAETIRQWLCRHPKASFELRTVSQATGLNKAKALSAFNALERSNVVRQIMKEDVVICVVNPNLYNNGNSHGNAPVLTPTPTLAPAPALAPVPESTSGMPDLWIGADTIRPANPHISA